MTPFQDSNNFEYSGKEELWQADLNLNNYNNHIVHKLSLNLQNATRVLDYGAGIGTLSLRWEFLTGVRPECFEIDEKLITTLQERGFLAHPNLDSIAEFDVVFSSNVLEHIEEDVSVLQDLNKKIKRGGYIALHVPAFQCLYSYFDFSVGHYRRYHKRELIRKLEESGFYVDKAYYSDCIGFFAWGVIKILSALLKKKPNISYGFSAYDKYFYPISIFLDGIGFRFLFGKNLIVIAKKI